MIQAKKLGWAAYVVSAALILFPLTDTFTSLYPWNIGEPRWRFGAVGLLSSALLIPMLGVLVALVTATVLEQRMARRVLGILCIAGAVVCLGALGSFALDALQPRAAVRPEMQLSFKVAAVSGTNCIWSGALMGWASRKKFGLRSGRRPA